jgi:hypothetical protein
MGSCTQLWPLSGSEGRIGILKYQSALFLQSHPSQSLHPNPDIEISLPITSPTVAFIWLGVKLNPSYQSMYISI